MGIKERLLKMTEDEQLELLSQYPMLVKRPILVMKSAALVGFDETRWIEQLNKEDGL
jgi:arsenate reductase